MQRVITITSQHLHILVPCQHSRELASASILVRSNIPLKLHRKWQQVKMQETKLLIEARIKSFHGKHAKEYHFFSSQETRQLQTRLLKWYSENQRILPWRRATGNSKHECPHASKTPSQRAYEVWVSEVMLQQTKVSTVIPFYNKFITTFPTLESLANAEYEQEVQPLWTGLGYYSRCKRLHEGAKVVLEKYEGKVPQDPEILVKHVPGIGPYTAGAITSIAYDVKTPLVDGNVIRVVTRLRGISASVTAKPTNDLIWKIADGIVPESSPGCFNQALMDLGAGICTPTSPKCNECPVSSVCRAFNETKLSETFKSAKSTKQDTNVTAQVEDATPTASDKTDSTSASEDSLCNLCPDIEDFARSLSAGVTQYPFKPPKPKARQEETRLLIVRRGPKDSRQVLMIQRPPKGLLANMWEFLDLNDIEDDDVKVREHDEEIVFGDVDFSQPEGTFNDRKWKWFPETQMVHEAISTGMKKCWEKAFGSALFGKGLKNSNDDSGTKGEKRGNDGDVDGGENKKTKKASQSKSSVPQANSKTKSIASFFKK